MDGWVRELSAAGCTLEGLLQSVEVAGARRRQKAPATLSQRQLRVLAQKALGPDGRLAQEKVFSRPDVAVALGPLLFGFQPPELLRAVEAVCVHPDAIALLGVKAAREQAFGPACVIATEAAIARNVAAQATKTGAAAVSPATVEAAIAVKEGELGRPLTEGQQAMVRGMRTSRVTRPRPTPSSHRILQWSPSSSPLLLSSVCGELTKQGVACANR